jgi:hypothetical protein
MQLRAGLLAASIVMSGCLDVPERPDVAGLANAQARPYEVWLIDQSDSPGKTFGGTLYIYDSDDLALANSNAAPRERLDLSGAVAALCNASTGANPVRPHMLLFSRNDSHAVLSFVASGHVVVIDATTRQPLSCIRTTQSPTGRQAHAAYPAPNGSFIVVTNQNGKLLERINADFRQNTYTHDAAATIDLATCTTPSGAPCQAPGIRPDNAPICPIVDGSSKYVFVTLRGGGMFVVDATQTPMQIVAEYEMSAVKGNGCGGIQVGGSMYINSGGRPGVLAHLEMFGFDVYRLPATGYAHGNRPNQPEATLVFSAPGEHDSHGMVATHGGRHIWAIDRHANVAEIIETSSGRRVNTVPLHGELSSDPAPDLIHAPPSGDRLFVALRGSVPLSGDPHIATGNTPGLGIIDVDGNGATGRLARILPISNVDAAGVERADAHAVRVRLR